MNDEKLLSSYIMGIYFIAMNRCDGLSPEENYEILEKSLKASSMFRKGLGTAENYLEESRMPGRLKWAEICVISDTALRDTILPKVRGCNCSR